MRYLAEAPPGTHPLVPVCGDGSFSIVVGKFYYCAFTIDTLTSTLLAVVVTLALCFLIANRLSHRVPGKLQANPRRSGFFGTTGGPVVIPSRRLRITSG